MHRKSHNDADMKIILFTYDIIVFNKDTTHVPTTSRFSQLSQNIINIHCVSQSSYL